MSYDPNQQPGEQAGGFGGPNHGDQPGGFGGQQGGFGGLPYSSQTSGFGGQLTSDERTWGMLAHISTLIAGIIGLPFLGPLLVLLTKGKESAFVKREATESLNFNILLIIVTMVAIVISVVTFGLGILLFFPIGIAALIFVIMGGVKANGGESYRYPVNLRLIKD